MMLTEKYPILSCANNKQVRRLVQLWQNFQTSLVLLIPNWTRHPMITYTNTVCLLSTIRLHELLSTIHAQITAPCSSQYSQ
jgi:hypothetical protein